MTKQALKVGQKRETGKIIIKKRKIKKKRNNFHTSTLALLLRACHHGQAKMPDVHLFVCPGLTRSVMVPSLRSSCPIPLAIAPDEKLSPHRDSNVITM